MTTNTKTLGQIAYLADCENVDKLFGQRFYREENRWNMIAAAVADHAVAEYKQQLPRHIPEFAPKIARKILNSIAPMNYESHTAMENYFQDNLEHITGIILDTLSSGETLDSHDSGPRHADGNNCLRKNAEDGCTGSNPAESAAYDLLVSAKGYVDSFAYGYNTVMEAERLSEEMDKFLSNIDLSSGETQESQASGAGERTDVKVLSRPLAAQSVSELWDIADKIWKAQAFCNDSTHFKSKVVDILKEVMPNDPRQHTIDTPVSSIPTGEAFSPKSMRKLLLELALKRVDEDLEENWVYDEIIKYILANDPIRRQLVEHLRQAEDERIEWVRRGERAEERYLIIEETCKQLAEALELLRYYFEDWDREGELSSKWPRLGDGSPKTCSDITRDVLNAYKESMK